MIGDIFPCFIPILNPFFISSEVSLPLSKYFSTKMSSVSATFSINFSLKPENSPGILSDSSIKSITALKVFPSI